METLTIAEAAEATGLTKKAIRNRVDRGQLRAVLRDGVRRIPRSELDRAGLHADSPDEADDGAAIRQGAASGQPRKAGAWTELLERLERQAGELAELRQLTREAESLHADRDRLEQALHQERAERQAAAQKARQEQEAAAEAQAAAKAAEEWQERVARAGWRERRRLLRAARERAA